MSVDRPKSDASFAFASRNADLGDPSGHDDFTHVILTRFNVRMPIYRHPGDDWLPKRIELFERFCLPSLRAQTVKKFKWLVFFDSQSPAWLRSRVVHSMSDVVTPVYVDGLFTGEYAAQIVREAVDTPFVITTRIDNDDAVAFDFVETIQREFSRQRCEFVNLVDGAQYAERKVYLRPYTRNPFVSLVETASVDDLMTVFVKRHYEVDLAGPVRNVRTSHPMWLQVVHGENVLTERVGLRTPAKRVSPHFACDLDVESSRFGYAVDVFRDGVRITWRIVRRPHRIIELAHAKTARKSAAPGKRLPVGAFKRDMSPS